MSATTQQIRLSIFDLLEKVEDKSLLTSLHDLLKNIVHSQGRLTKDRAGYTWQGEELTVEKLEELLLQRDASIQSGNFIRHEDMLTKFEAYRKQKATELL